MSLDICIDEEDGVVIGTGGRAQKYAAQIVIPARRYDVIEDGEYLTLNSASLLLVNSYYIFIFVLINKNKLL